MEDSNLEKFPITLQLGFKKYNLGFPDTTEWDYKPIQVYRMIFREKDDCFLVGVDDFRSYAELPGYPRRGREDDVKNPNFYGVSTFTDKKKLCNIMHLPKPGKKLAIGHLVPGFGPIYKALPHICLWVLKENTLSENDFRVCDYE
jgi:hypothetical protein